MKSVVLIVWLLAGDGRQHLLFSQHFDDQAACRAAAEAAIAAHPGERLRYLCQEVVPENEDVDEYGNPIKP